MSMRPRPQRQDGLTGGTGLNMKYSITFTEISFYPETSNSVTNNSNNSYNILDRTRI